MITFKDGLMWAESKKSKIMIVAATLLWAVTLWFNSGAKAENGYALASYSLLDTNRADFAVTTLGGGYKYNDFLAIEGRLALSTEPERHKAVTYDMGYMFGAFLTFSLPLHDEWVPYAILGHTEGNINAISSDGSRSHKTTSTSTGGGILYEVKENWSIRGEYIKLSEDLTQTGITVVFNF
jgi:opacity protein-like surface antigen